SWEKVRACAFIGGSVQWVRDGHESNGRRCCMTAPSLAVSCRWTARSQRPSAGDALYRFMPRGARAGGSRNGLSGGAPGALAASQHADSHEKTRKYKDIHVRVSEC